MVQPVKQPAITVRHVPRFKLYDVLVNGWCIGYVVLMGKNWVPFSAGRCTGENLVLKDQESLEKATTALVAEFKDRVRS